MYHRGIVFKAAICCAGINQSAFGSLLLIVNFWAAAEILQSIRRPTYCMGTGVCLFQFFLLLYVLFLVRPTCVISYCIVLCITDILASFCSSYSLHFENSLLYVGL